MQQQKMKIPTLEEIMSNWEETGLKKKLIFTLTEQYIKRLRVNVNNIFTEILLKYVVY